MNKSVYVKVNKIIILLYILVIFYKNDAEQIAIKITDGY